MRITLDLDEQLLKRAMNRTKARTKTETVEMGLKELIKAEQRRRSLTMEGKGHGMALRAFLYHRSGE